MRKFHFASICNVLPCELRLFWYLTGALNQLADCRPTVGRHLANKLPTCCQQSADSRPTNGQQSADCWQKIFVKGGQRQSANSRPTVGQQLADCRPTVGWGSCSSFFPDTLTSRKRWRDRGTGKKSAKGCLLDVKLG